MKKRFSLDSVLSDPYLYRVFLRMIGGTKKKRRRYVEAHIRPKRGDKILDIGCGTANLLAYLPDVEYHGFDRDEVHINHAAKRFKSQGKFTCCSIEEFELGDNTGSYDSVLATGVLHHLDDKESLQLLRLASSALKEKGRVVTFDGCYVKNQNRIARLALSRDRGNYIRTKEEYERITQQVFAHVNLEIFNDFLLIPYTVAIMECRKE